MTNYYNDRYNTYNDDKSLRQVMREYKRTLDDSVTVATVSLIASSTAVITTLISVVL